MQIAISDCGTADGQLRDFWRVEQDAQRHDRPDPVLRSLEALAQTVRQHRSDRWQRHLVAQLDGQVVGVASVTGSLGENEHVGDVEIDVLPSHRRQGVGRALADEVRQTLRARGCTTVTGEVHQPAVDVASPGANFAGEVFGATSAHAEWHLRLAVPPADDVVARLRARTARHAADHEVVTWRDRCPDDLVAAYCELNTQMANDVPTGDLDWEPVSLTVEQLRAREERLRDLYEVVVAAVRVPDGPLVGYSIVYLPRGESEAIQDDTLVMPSYRGRRLGTLLKLATLGVLTGEHPECTALHTWTALDNAPMLRTNRQFGYEPVEVFHQMQAPLDVTSVRP